MQGHFFSFPWFFFCFFSWLGTFRNWCSWGWKKNGSGNSGFCVCVLQLGGVVFRWGLAGKQTQSQGGAEELMARNGGVPKKHTQIQNTVRDTCIEAKTVQESLWKLFQLQILHQPSHQSPPPPTPPILTLSLLSLLQWLLKPPNPIIIPITIPTTAPPPFIPSSILIPPPLDLLALAYHLNPTPIICFWTLDLILRLIGITGTKTISNCLWLCVCFLYSY